EVTPQASLPERLAVGCVFAMMLGASVAAHELAHALAARARGKPVDSLTLYLFGGTANVNDRGLSPSDEIVIGVAGPIASILVAAVFITAGALLLHTNKAAGGLVLEIGLANVLLALFNALPGFPMDGGRVLRGILWKASGNAVSATKRASSAGRIIAYTIVALGPVLMFENQIAAGIWLSATGWLLAALAQSYYKAMLLKIALDGLHVSDLCARDLPVLQTSDTVAAAAAHFGGGAMSRTLPVLFGERAAGVVTDVQIAAVPASDAATTTVSAVMTRAFELPILEPGIDAAVLPPLLATSAHGAALVEADGAYAGLVRREDVNRYVEMVEDIGNSVAARRGVRAMRDRHMRYAQRAPRAPQNPP
ncbi:MAG TPA: site-2 protease family protein, partial [Candidatus Eremiobacteraceae bacterium]|nr:site-2 protease family protein [Candidatus Eremiobacteraceae bacterium]